MIVQTMIVQTRVHYAEAETEALVLLRLGAKPAVSPTPPLKLEDEKPPICQG